MLWSFVVYKIGNLELKSRILLSPMLEPNDIAFRLLCKRAGAGLTYTGMASPLSKQKLDLDDKPALQLFGNSPKGIESFMKKYDSEVSLWDFNLGCPSKLSKRLGHGGGLSDLNVIEEILKVMVSSTKKPVTIKIRKSDYALDLVRMAERVGVSGVCVHTRSVSQGYSGYVDYEFALEVKRAISIPVIFSGDVESDNTPLGDENLQAIIEKVLKDFDFVMIGRAAIGNPGIFGKGDVGFSEYLKLAKKYELYFRQIKYQAMNFTKGIAGGKKLRVELIEAKNVLDIERVMGPQTAYPSQGTRTSHEARTC